jgi:hypothetical protein
MGYNGTTMVTVCLLPALMFLPAITLFAAAQAQTPPGPTILGPGVYVMDELSEDPAGEWLGLVHTPGGAWRLEMVAAQIRPTLLEGDPPHSPSGLRIGAVGSGRVLLMMRGLSFPGARVQAAEARAADAHAADEAQPHGSPRRTLPAADLPAADVSYSPSRLPGEQTITCSLGAGTFRIWGEPVGGTGKAVIKMSMRGRTQELYMVANDADTSWDVLWAGDMDGDGAPDVLLAVAESGMGRKRLLLSGKAGSRDMVGLAGEHKYSFGN